MKRVKEENSQFEYETCYKQVLTIKQFCNNGFFHSLFVALVSFGAIMTPAVKSTLLASIVTREKS